MSEAAEKREDAFSIFGESGEIRNIPAEVDHFTFFGLQKKPGVDRAILDEKFYELSRRLHPDFFMDAPVSVRIRSLDASARLNEAYKTLKDPVRRAVYLVEITSGKLEEGDTKPPAHLFEEVLEAQEAAEEFQCCDDQEEAGALLGRVNAAKECFEALRDGQRAALEDLAGRWDEAVDAGRSVPPEAIKKMRSILSQRNYIENTLRSLRDVLEAGR